MEQPGRGLPKLPRLVTATGSLGARYTPGEVLRYKLSWEKRCAEADAGEIDSPVEEVHETKLIKGGKHEDYPFNMVAGDELVFAIVANDYLDIVICDEQDLDEWAGEEIEIDEDDEDRPLPAGYWHKTDVINCGDQRFEAPEDGRYVLLLINWDDEATEVIVDAAVWEAEE